VIATNLKAPFLVARAFGPGSSVTMCGTGRSPAIRDVPDDKAHLFAVTVDA